MTHEQRISNIQVAKAPVPIQVRVVRKWKPFANATKLCYLLLDKYGDAIQALIEQAEDVKAPNKLAMMNCYRVEQYNCIPAPRMYRVALHSAAIRIDASTPFVPINDDGGIPETYYNFVPFGAMALRANLNRVLTDFLGMVYAIEFGDPEKNTPRIKLHLEETSGETIQVALWPEIAETLDIEMLLSSNFKLIIALASVRVTRYNGTVLQLESSSATRIEIEPELEAARTLRVSYHGRHPVEDPTDVSSQKIQVLPGPAEKNRVTVADLLQRQIYEHKGMVYTCDAEIADFMPQQSWRYGTCPVCSVTMDPQEGSYVCTKHREQEPNFKYCVKCDLSDGTGTISVTIFDQAMFDILKVSCNDMVRVHGNVQPMTIPDQIQVLKNQRRIYQLNNVSADAGGNLRFAVNRTYKAQVGVKRPLEEASSSSQPAGKKAALILTETPPRNVLASEAVNLPLTPAVDVEKTPHVAESTPPTPAVPVTGMSSQPGKTPAASTTSKGVVKQLFKDKGDDSSAGAEKHEE